VHVLAGHGALLEGVVVVLHPEVATEDRMVVAGHVAGREDALDRGLAVLVDQDAVVDLHPAPADELHVGLDAHADHHRLALDPPSPAGLDELAVCSLGHRLHLLAGAQVHAVLPVDLGEHLAQLNPEGSLERRPGTRGR
jgi:hypothetical protein